MEKGPFSSEAANEIKQRSLLTIIKANGCSAELGPARAPSEDSRERLTLPLITAGPRPREGGREGSRTPAVCGARRCHNNHAIAEAGHAARCRLLECVCVCSNHWAGWQMAARTYNLTHSLTHRSSLAHMHKHARAHNHRNKVSFMKAEKLM